jgi:hypothetical protein
MLRCNTAQAAEDGPPKVERSAGEKYARRWNSAPTQT